MDIKKSLQEVFRDVFNDDTIELFDGMSANDIKDWDSITHVILILSVKKKFNVKFQAAEIISLQNVGGFIALLEKKLNS
jgi:acyl carrier protein